MDEENFPRGGVVRPVLDKKIKRKHKKEQDLFKDAVDVSSKKDQKRNKHLQKENLVTPANKPEVLFSNKIKVKKEKNNESDEKPVKKKKGDAGDELIKPEQLSDMYISESMLLLGYVSEVKDVGLVMALPRGRRGLVPITKISNDYLKCLEEFSGATNSTNNTEVLHSLADLFKVGSLIPCRVMRGDPTTGLTQLSINPEVINQTLSVDSVKKATIVHGCVSSCEDTGYMVDLGLEKKGFLKNKNTVQYIQTHNEGKRLKLGQTVRCRLLKQKSKDEKFLAVTVEPEQINEPVRNNITEMSDLVPGMRITATIKHIKDQRGAIVSFNNQIGFVHLSHLPQNLTTYSEGDKIDCCVLYMDTRSGNQSVTLSALPHIVNYTGEPVHLLGFGTLCIGRYLRDATVSHTKAKGVFVKLEGKALGLADLNNIDENTEYKKGTKVRCIVTAIDYEANRVQVSFKQNVIEELVRPSDLVGDIVKGKITCIEKRTELNIMGKFNGRLTKKQSCQDVTYQKDMTISCRVLFVSKKDVLVLCNKAWAMEPKYPIVTSKDHLEPYQTLECYVAHKRKEEYQVCSYGAIEGILSKKWTEEVEMAQGDPVVCQVMRFEEKKGIIFCSKDSCDEFSVPIEAVGSVIGKGGKTIKSLTKDNNIKIQFKEGTCFIYGPKKDREKAKTSILEMVNRFTNGTGIELDRKRNNSDRSETEPGTKKQKLSADSDEKISFQRSLTGRVIGARGSNISMLEEKSGAKLSIKADKNNSELSVCHISGTDEAIAAAKERLNELISSFVVDKEGKPSGKERQDSEGSSSPLKRQRSDSTMSEEGDGDNEEGTESQKKQKLSQTLLIPLSKVGKLIGPKGKTINSLEAETKAKVAIRNENIDATSRVCFITGSKEAIKAAKARIEMLLGSHDDGVRQEKTPRKAPKANETVVKMRIFNTDIGKVIGKKGANINKIRFESGASVSVDCVSEGDDKTWDCVISGTQESTTKAESMVKECLNVSPITEIVVEEISIPKLFVGKILGKGGKTIDKIRAKSGARVFLKDSELEVDTKVCCISGRAADVMKAKRIVEGRLNPITKTKDGPKVDEDETQENEDEDKAEADDDELDSLDSEEEEEPDSSVEVTIMVPVACIEKLLQNKTMIKLQEESPAKIVLAHEDDQEDGLCTITGAEDEVMQTKTKFEKILKKVLEKVSIKKKEVKPSLQLSDSLTWDSDLKLPSQQKNDSSSEDSEDEELQKPVKKTKAEKRKEKNEEEKRIYEYERKKLEGDIVPETADDFDRLVVNSPNSSVVWLRYMAFHLETSEIDKARAVADRALKTISFREEREKLNIWVAYLNLENMYGTNETLGKVLARAIQQCEPLDVYLPLVNMYVESSKIEEAERLYSIMVKKYSANKMVWAKFGEFYFQQNRPESARKIFKRALKSLENRDHVETISKFAQLEFKYGEPETGKVMFENLLSTYPKRTDIWSVYVDLLTKLKEHTVTRGVYNRMINIRLPAKKIKFFFKKYLEFEEKYGNETQIAEVKKKALDYVESGGIKEREVKAE